MKLRNKKTGEIGWLYCDHISVPKKMTVFAEDKDLSANHWDYASLSDLNEEWEDYEEPKGTYFINTQGDIQFWDSRSFAYPDDWIKEKQIGNYFETKEEAEKAVEKIKAWKRLKDNGFRFSHHSFLDRKISYKVPVADEKIGKDLDLLFGGEE